MPAATEPAPSAAILRSRARRDQILSAAAKLFGENGFHGSSMAELAKRAGMSVGHIYHYFENKDAIIEALVDREMEELSGLLDEVHPSGDVLTTLMDRLDAIVDRRLDRDTLPLALEILAEDGRLAAYVDEYKSIVATNGGFIVVKCAFQMISKSQQVARKLDDVAFQLTEKMHDFSEEMAAEMQRS